MGRGIEHPRLFFSKIERRAVPGHYQSGPSANRLSGGAIRLYRFLPACVPDFGTQEICTQWSPSPRPMRQFWYGTRSMGRSDESVYQLWWFWPASSPSLLIRLPPAIDQAFTTLHLRYLPLYKAAIKTTTPPSTLKFGWFGSIFSRGWRQEEQIS